MLRAGERRLSSAQRDHREAAGDVGQLLRVLEDGRVLRLGATKELPIDVREFAASKRSLHQAIREGRLREDPYYRLNVYTCRVASAARSAGGPADMESI